MTNAQFDFIGDVSSTFIKLPFENKVVPTTGKLGVLRLSTSHEVCYKGTPIYPVSVYPECLLGIEKVGRRYYYVVKTPLKGGYWRNKKLG